MFVCFSQGWKERPIFGKIRFMNYAGCKRKFKVDQFVAKYYSTPKKLESSTAKKQITRAKPSSTANKKKLLEHLEKRKSPPDAKPSAKKSRK